MENSSPTHVREATEPQDHGATNPRISDLGCMLGLKIKGEDPCRRSCLKEAQRFLVCIFTLTKATPDHRGQNLIGGELTEEGREKYHRRLDYFFTADPNRQHARGNITLKSEYLANKYHLVAFDGALRHTLGWAGLKTFEAQHEVAPLSKGQTRFRVPLQDLPEELRAVSPGRIFRSCLEGPGEEDSCLEANWSERRCVVQDFSDMGAIGWYWKPFVYCVGKVRGWYWPDPLHRRHNGWKMPSAMLL